VKHLLWKRVGRSGWAQQVSTWGRGAGGAPDPAPPALVARVKVFSK
jgi:hypothetical protein